MQKQEQQEEVETTPTVANYVKEQYGGYNYDDYDYRSLSYNIMLGIEGNLYNYLDIDGIKFTVKHPSGKKTFSFV